MRARRMNVQMAEYEPGPSEVPNPPKMKCKCGCGTILPEYKRRRIAAAKGWKTRVHPADRYLGSCWRRKLDEYIKSIPGSYAMKKRGRDEDRINVKKPKTETV
jgi:hypothetical protein